MPLPSDPPPEPKSAPPKPLPGPGLPPPPATASTLPPKLLSVLSYEHSEQGVQSSSWIRIVGFPQEAAGHDRLRGPALSAGKRRLHDIGARVKHAAQMTGDEMGECLRAIGWEPTTLAQRLGVRPDTVRSWLAGRREIPPNLERWLLAVRDGVASAGPLPENWRSGAGC
jgi:hypothetical protein